VYRDLERQSPTAPSESAPILRTYAHRESRFRLKFTPTWKLANQKSILKFC